MVVMDNHEEIQANFLAEALNVVRLKFVDCFESMNETEEYAPEFAHQHFGENERIFGYENLKVVINYTSASMYVYPTITFERTVDSVDTTYKPDDIITLLKEQLPSEQMHMMVENVEAFDTLVTKQKMFKPYGNLLSKFVTGEHSFELYKVSESSLEFDNYLTRVQTLGLWYIDAAQFTDNTDVRWKHYFLYEAKRGQEGDGSIEYALAGFCSMYHFYAYPERERPRVAQMMLLPNYRQSGNGAKLLQSVYNDLITNSAVYDITVEDPADNFIYLRDYVDCLNCGKLPEFSSESLKGGFSASMSEAAVTKYKINKKQSRRVYEILRLKCTDMSNTDDVKAYRIDVKRRIYAPNRKSAKDIQKIEGSLTDEEVAEGSIAQDKEHRIQELQQAYQTTISEYKKTINRLNTFSSVF